MSHASTEAGQRQPVTRTLTALRVLLIVEAVGGMGALLLLSAYLLVTVLFGAFPLALYVLLVWVAMALAIVATLVGQQRIRRGERSWWWAMTALQALVVAIGIAILGFSVLSPAFGIPAPPTRNLLLALMLPALATVNLVLLLVQSVGPHAARSRVRDA